MESTSTSADDAQTLADRVETLKSSLQKDVLGEERTSTPQTSSPPRVDKVSSTLLPCFSQCSSRAYFGQHGILRLISPAQPLSRQLMDLARGFESIEAERDSLLAERARLQCIV